MRSRKLFLKTVLFIAVLISGFGFRPSEETGKQKIEVVFCLDLSASTNGILNDIRDNLWHFIEITREKYPNADLRIGIVGFARPSFGVENNFVKVLSDISDDYDLISYNLFLLKSNIEKGDQCDGSAIYTSLKDLHWSNDPGSKKMIFIFGNSNVKMCGYDYLKACEIAKKENILIHSVYCSRGVFINKYFPMWNEMAESTGGDFNTYIVTNRSPNMNIAKETKNLLEWNDNSLDTYVPFTKDGKLNYDLMVAADENSKKMNEQAFHERCMYKLSEKFSEKCSKWDLVTAMNTSSIDLKSINRNYLPLEFKKLTSKELEEILKIKAEKRAFYKEKIYKILLTSDPVANNQIPLDSIFLGGITKETNLAFNKIQGK